MRFRAILFDVHQTLIRKDYTLLSLAQRNAAAVLQEAGYDVTLEALTSAWEQNRRQVGARLANGRHDEVEFYTWYESLLGLAGIPRAPVELIDRFNDVFASSFAGGIAAFPGAPEALTELRRRYTLGIISNSLGRNTRFDLRIAGLYDYFTHFSISSEIGKRKPHPAIFQSALDGLGMTAAAAVMVGDHPGEDVRGARQVGMTAIQVAAPGTEASPEADAVIHDLSRLVLVVERLEDAHS
ncbi:MAG: HAD family hydrolase [Candidatus Tectomicrobia bacterium]|nr:HAD family hydrolase [Candidatus Tectomicrobia bacterium]